MSTFEGITREYPGISIDRFDGKNLASTLYILSHFHSDHTVGLASELFKERILSNPDLKVYCSEVTRSLVLVEDSYAFLKDALVPLADNVPSELLVTRRKDDVSTSNDSMQEPIVLTLLPAGHCPGSVMCLIEGSSGRVLYTGDYRISADRFKLLKSVFDANGNPKALDSLYVDTTFFHPGNTFIPSRSYSLFCATEVIGHWIDQGRSKITHLKFKASLGCEHLLSAIGKHFNTKIHVSDYKFKQCSNIGNLSDLFTTDPNLTQIHACDSITPSTDLKKQKRKNNSSPKGLCQCRVLRDVKPEDLCILTFSAMFFTGASTLDKYCIPVGTNHFKICYSLHPSYDEVCQLVEALKPKRAFANVTKLGSKTPKCYDVQQELDKVVERSLTSNSRTTTSDAGKELERSLKRQFSEDSMDNFLFEETQSYLRSNSKRPRLEDYDLSADINGLSETRRGEVVVSPSGDMTTDTSKKRKRGSLEDDEGKENPFQRWVKRISTERQALQEHISRCSQNDDHEVSLERSASEEDGLDECDTDEENKLLDTSNSDLEGRVATEDEGFVPDGPVEDRQANHCGSLSVAFESINHSDNSCQIASQTGNSTCVGCQSETSCQLVDRSESSHHESTKDKDTLMINLCNDEDVPSDEEAIKESRSDVLFDSDVTVELNSSIDAGVPPPRTETEGFVARPTPKCSTPANSPPGTQDLESGDILRVVGEPTTSAEGQSKDQNTYVPSGQRVVCIDLTEDVDEEEEEEDENVNEGGSNIVHHPLRSRRKSDEDDDEDDCGYDGGDEWDSSDFNNDHNEEREGPAAVTAQLTEAGDEDDSNDRTSGYDSDTPHFTELQRKSHARFEKLYKRKQRKIKIKTRRQTLRNVSKDDVIVIDDDDTTDTSDDSYDYDSGDSSSDYDHYPGKGRGSKRSTDDNEQFLMPSMSSSSESSQTLSSEDNVVVVVNSKSQEEGEDDDEEVRNGGEEPEKSIAEAPPSLTNQNGERC